MQAEANPAGQAAEAGVSNSDRLLHGSRLQAIDALRGAIMILMALDHVRDFFHSSAMAFTPDDLTRTTAVLFFTRWITHFCAPVFALTAGMGAFLWKKSRSSRTNGELSRFLVTRGVWLAILELTVMRLGYDFSFSGENPIFLLVLWMLGLSMIVLAALIYLPEPWLAALSLAVIAGHNSLDGIAAARFGPAAGIWNVIHQPGAFRLAGHVFLVGYPLMPWFAVMAGGFCLGAVYLWDPEKRRRLVTAAGFAITGTFLILRGVNLYGNPVHWAAQKSAVFTLLSFLNCTKYPPSLDFLLMTLGPALMALGFLDGRRFSDKNPLIVFGRVPLFFFILHFYSIHLLAALLALGRYGGAAWSFIFQPLPSMGGPRALFPADFGYPLGVVYLIWVLLVAALYPVCRWYASIKARRRYWWLSYL